jgi:thymidylate synthase
MKTPFFSIQAKTVNDLWFRTLYAILETDKNGDFIHAYQTGTIQAGSFEGEQSRLQFPYFLGFVEYPLIDPIVVMPEGSNIPAPTSAEKAQEYFERYIIGSELAENETYTYGQRINISLFHVLEMLKDSPITNQAIIEIGRPDDIYTCLGKDGKLDPPCLRLITFKVIPHYSNGVLERARSKLNMSVWLRSWDLYAGMPENLAGLVKLQEFVSDEIGIPVGHLYAASDGLHLYAYQKELAELRTRLSCPQF